VKDEETELPFDVTPEEVRRRLERNGLRIVDVRTPLEFSIARIEGSTLLPLAELAERFAELDPGEELAIICHHGPRSTQAVRFLRRQGYAKARNVAGGIDAWSRDVDASVPRY